MKHASTGGLHQSIIASHDKCARVGSLTFNGVWDENVTEAWSLAEGQQWCGFLVGLDLGQRFISWVEGQNHIWQVYQLCYILNVVDKCWDQAMQGCAVAEGKFAVLNVDSVPTAPFQQVWRKAALVPVLKHRLQELLVSLSQWQAVLLGVLL